MIKTERVLFNPFLQRNQRSYISIIFKTFDELDIGTEVLPGHHELYEGMRPLDLGK